MLRRVRVRFTGQSGWPGVAADNPRQDRRLRNRQSRGKVNKFVHESVIMDMSGSTEAAPPCGGGGQEGWTHHDQSL
jgi:hypothetical protein